MIYSVHVSREAEDAIVDYLNYIGIEQQAPLAAARMLARIEVAQQALSTFPRRCALAPENEFTPFEIRMLIVYPCLLLFTVDDDNRQVQILRFRHGRQLPIRDITH